MLRNHLSIATVFSGTSNKIQNSLISSGRSGLTVWHIRVTAGRGQQSRGIRLSVMAMTWRGGEEGVCAFPLSELLGGGPWETARPIRTGLVMRSGGRVGGNTVSLAEEASVKQGAGKPD
ncbi:UNVERIFIED_CONTAM: hypothetical protein FKN15_023502 [Acipenser sinensis]